MSKNIIYQGIDVSRWQGTINWAKVKSVGVDFAIIRAGYCGYAGGLVEDVMFQANIKGAIDAGIDVGVYLYSYAKTASAAKTAARELLALVKGYTLTYPVVFDMETDGTSYASMSKAENTAIAKAFLSTVAEAGYCPMLYSFKSFAESNLNISDLPYDFWLAHVGTGGAALSSTSYTGAYTIWQYSWTGKVDGISGDVDLDYCYKDYPAYVKENGLNGFTADDSTGDVPDGLEVPADPDTDEEDVQLEPSGTTYKVVKDDNLTRIAARHNCPLRIVLQANPTVTNAVTGQTRQLSNPNLIYVGDLIHIPAKPA